MELQFEYLLGIVVFGCTVGAYLVFLILGRKWRKEYERKGEKYWKVPKEKRVKELTSDVWRPKLVALSYFMAYFSNGFMKMAYSWTADKWGHKRVWYKTGFASAVTGFLWVTLQTGMVVWFIFLASFSNFLERLSTGGRMALMGDATPLALSSTVYQMYMSFTWIGNVPCSVIVGLLLPINLALLMVLLSIFSLIPVIIAKWLKPFETAKASKV